jgi:glycosyltransferase involved in cell wall biosynthesis
MKIVYITESLVLMGGSEKILTEKANTLAEQFNYDITIITCTQPNEQPNAFPLSKLVKQINLNIPYYRQYHYSYPKRLWVKHMINTEFQENLTKEILGLSPDIIICLAGFKADLISSVKCKAKKIIECHEARYFVMSDFDKRKSVLSRIYSNVYQRWHYFRTIEKEADIVVSLTEGDKLLWKKAKRVEVIPNFSTMHVSHYCDLNKKRIIAVGRLSPEKGYERLINVWEIVSPKHPDWSLDIFGDGRLRDELNNLIAEKRLKNISINHATPDISQEYANSSICAMTSHLEGFGLVLLEALMHGLPCIAFDCPFGPGAIIEDNKCGFLVKDRDISQYAERLGQLMSDISLRKNFSLYAIEHAKKYSVDTVMHQWIKLFEGVSPKQSFMK